ncbi:Hypothetical protein UVM_LOCUS32 [uncultured virus]|nr:Hypothetical protein UVM_LOCUS32 [uncultured virus]
MSGEPAKKKTNLVAITDPTEAKVAMINGRFELPKETLIAMDQIRAAAAEFADKLVKITAGVKKDGGRFAASIQKLQSLKNVACDSVILPHASKEVEDADDSNA